MDQFDRIFQQIIKHEGTAFTNIAQDKGKETKFGLTLATLQKLEASMTAELLEQMSQTEARGWYLQLYVESNCDSLDLDDESKNYYFDMYINGGPRMAGCCLQAAINHRLSTTDQSQWINVDGVPGNGTREALRRVGGVTWLELAMQRAVFFVNNVLKGCRYRWKQGQEPNRNDQEIFLYGWLRRCFLLADDGRTELKQYDSQQLRAELEKRGEL